MNRSILKQNSLKRAIAICLLLTGASLPTAALQVFDGINGATIYAKISKKEPTRIALDQGRISTIRAREGSLNISTDEASGQLFVSVHPDAEKHINAFLTTEAGHTYTLILEVIDSPSDSLIIKQPKTASKTPVLTGPKASPFDKDIKKLLTAIVNDTPPDGVEVVNERKIVALWREVTFVQDLQYLASDAIAERFILTNISKSDLVMSEREFYKKGVHAVALEQHALIPGAFTKVYIIRAKALND